MGLGADRLARIRWWLIPLSFFLMCAGWAVASPTGSSPDDDYHLSSIWCTRDGAPGVCEPGSSPTTRAVPSTVVDASACYRFRLGPSAACVDAQEPATPTETDRVNQVQQLYPGGFYSALGPLVGTDVGQSVLLMRLANAALASVLMAAVLLLAPAAIASAATVAIVATYIPLGLFVTGSTNPSSWAVNGLIAVWALGLAWLRAPQVTRGRGLALTLALIASAVITMASRVDANAYLVLTVIVIVTLNGWRALLADRSKALVMLGLVAAAVAVYVTTSSLAVAGVGFGGGGSPLGSADAGMGLLLTNVVHLPVLLQGMVGGWALGWNDAAMPPAVFVSGVFVLGMLALRGLQVASPRVAVATALCALGLIGVPLLFLQIQQLGVGELVQPRYLLPLLTIAIATVSLGADDGTPAPMRPLVAGVIALITFATATVAHWTLLHRYVAGTDQPLIALDLDLQWHPVTSVVPTLLATAIATAVFIALVMQQAASSPRDARPVV